MSGPGRLGSIQYLRAAAAGGVVIYHALQWRSGGFDVGRAGVDIFFVVSGLVLWRSIAARPIGPAAFLAARARRILPGYWLLTLAVAALAAAWPSFLPQVRLGGAHLALSLLLVPHLDPRGLPFPTLPPGWSLCYEAIFYGLFAAALLLPRRWRAAGLIGALFAVTIAGFVLADPAYILGANPMLLEFAAGVGLGLVVERDRLPARPWGWALLLAGAAALAATQAPGLFSELWRPLLWGAPATLIVAGAVTIERRGGVPCWPAGLALGDASYALYLVHLPVAALLAHACGAAPWPVFLLLAIGGSVAAALAFHGLVEQPLARRLGRARIETLYRPDGFNRLDAASAPG